MTTTYKKLGSFSSSTGNTNTTVWAGDDHFLLARIDRHIGFHETYSRYFYRDIQYIVACKTLTGAVTHSILAALATVCAAGAVAGLYFGEDGMPATIILSIVLVPLALFLFFSWIFRGIASCRVSIKTISSADKEIHGQLRRSLRLIDKMALHVRGAQTASATERGGDLRPSTENEGEEATADSQPGGQTT